MSLSPAIPSPVLPLFLVFHGYSIGHQFRPSQVYTAGANHNNGVGQLIAQTQAREGRQTTTGQPAPVYVTYPLYESIEPVAFPMRLLGFHMFWFSHMHLKNPEHGQRFQRSKAYLLGLERSMEFIGRFKERMFEDKIRLKALLLTLKQCFYCLQACDGIPLLGLAEPEPRITNAKLIRNQVASTSHWHGIPEKSRQKAEKSLRSVSAEEAARLRQTLEHQDQLIQGRIQVYRAKFIYIQELLGRVDAFYRELTVVHRLIWAELNAEGWMYVYPQLRTPQNYWLNRLNLRKY